MAVVEEFVHGSAACLFESLAPSFAVSSAALWHSCSNPFPVCVRGRSPSMEHRSKQSPCSLAHTKVCGDQDVSLADDPQNSSEQAVFICWILVL